MATHKVTRSLTSGSKSLSSTNTYTVQSEVIMAETVDDGASELNFLVALDVSALKTFSMVADQVLTVKTNSSGSPQETFTLIADVAVDWQEGETALFAGDITSLYVTNASGTAATFELIAGVDAPST